MLFNPNSQRKTISSPVRYKVVSQTCRKYKYSQFCSSISNQCVPFNGSFHFQFPDQTENPFTQNPYAPCHSMSFLTTIFCHLTTLASNYQVLPELEDVNFGQTSACNIYIAKSSVGFFVHVTTKKDLYTYLYVFSLDSLYPEGK